MQLQDYSAPDSADCTRFHSRHDQSRKHAEDGSHPRQSVSSANVDNRLQRPSPSAQRATHLLDENARLQLAALSQEDPVTLVKMWEQWDRRVTSHITQQQGHKPPQNSYASPTRSSCGKLQGTHSTRKSRRKFFSSVLIGDEEVERVVEPIEVQVVAPPVKHAVLVPYRLEEDTAPVVAAVLSTQISDERLQRLQERRKQNSLIVQRSKGDVESTDKPARSALEQLADEEFAHPRPSQPDSDKNEATKSTKAYKGSAKRTAKVASPREKKKFNTAVASRGHVAQDTPVSHDPHSEHSEAFPSEKEDGDEALGQAAGSFTAPNGIHSSAGEEAAHDVPDDVAPQHVQEHVVKHGDTDGNDNKYDVRQETAPTTQSSNANNNSANDDDEEVDEEEEEDVEEDSECNDADSADGNPPHPYIAFVALSDAEAQSRLRIVNSNAVALQDIFTSFTIAMYYAHVGQTFICEEEASDRLRIISFESLDVAALFAAHAWETAERVKIAAAVIEDEQAVRCWVMQQEGQEWYEAILLVSCETSCNESTRVMMKELDQEQAQIVEEIELMHEDDIAGQKAHTKSIIEEYEQLIQFTNENFQNEKNELLQVFSDDKFTAIKLLTTEHREQSEGAMMCHEDAVSRMSQKHAAEMKNRATYLQRIAISMLSTSTDNEAALASNLRMRDAFLRWSHFLCIQKADRATICEQVDRAIMEQATEERHCQEVVVLQQEVVFLKVTCERWHIEAQERAAVVDELRPRWQFTTGALSVAQNIVRPLNEELVLLTHDSSSLQLRVRELEDTLRKTFHLYTAQRMATSAFAAKFEQQEVLDSALRQDARRLKQQRNLLCETLSRRVTSQRLSEAFTRWLSLASSQPLRKLRILRKEEQQLRHELRCWNEHAANMNISAPSEIASTFASSLRSSSAAAPSPRPKWGSGARAPPPAAAAPAMSGDTETIQALKHLLARERQQSAKMREELAAHRTVIAQSSDALEGSLAHAEGLQQTLHNIRSYAEANTIDLSPFYVTSSKGRDLKTKGDNGVPTQLAKSITKRNVAFAADVGGSDPYEQF